MGNEGEQDFCNERLFLHRRVCSASLERGKKTTMNISRQEINKSRINIDAPEGAGDLFVFFCFFSF